MNMIDKKTSRLGLIVPLFITLIVCGLWSLYWFMAAQKIQTGLLAQMKRLNDQNLTISTLEPLKVGGYPFRFSVVAKDFKINGKNGQGISAPLIMLEANAYQPKKWVAAAPSGLEWQRGQGASLKLTAQALRAGVHIDDAQSFQNLSFVGDNIVFDASGAPFMLKTAKKLELYLRPSTLDNTQGALDFLVKLTDAQAQDGQALAKITKNAPLKAHFEGSVIGAQQLLTVSHLQGDVRIEADGAQKQSLFGLKSDRLSLDAASYLNGALRLDLEGDIAIFDWLVALGIMEDKTSSQVGLFFGQALRLNGKATVALDFKDREIFMGPVRLGAQRRLG